MPLPRIIAKANRIILNRVMRPISRWIPPLALIRHQGRTSGKRYETPIMVFPHDGEFVIALTYGPDTDWQLNLEAAGAAEVVYRGRTYNIADPRRVHGSAADQPLPRLVQVALRVFRVDDFLYVTATQVPPREG
jgi:deazaflavin-dependent oxidoreductase (nitroreductase family)